MVGVRKAVARVWKKNIKAEVKFRKIRMLPTKKVLHIKQT